MGSFRKSLCGLLLIGWILGIHNGYIALWKEDMDSPSIVFPYKATLLPPEECNRLEEGICIPSKPYLEFLLMNYFS